MVATAESWHTTSWRWRGVDFLPGGFVAAVSLISVIIVGMLAIVLWLSFQEGSLVGDGVAFGLANYAQIFLDPFTYRVVFNTLAFSLVTLAVALAIGVPIAWVTECTDLRGKSVIFTLMAVGLLIPGFAAAMGWLFLLHPRIGLVNGWLRDLIGLSEPLFDVTGFIGMGWVQGLNLAPLAFIMTSAVFAAMDPSLEESARMAGATFRQTLRRITFPMAWPGILAAGIYIFTIGFAAFDVPAILGWSSRRFTFSTYLVLQLNPEDALPRYGTAAALSSFLILFAALFSYWYGRMQRRAHRFQVVTGKAYRPHPVKIGRASYLVWGLIGFYFCLSKLLPLLTLFWASVLPYFRLPSARAFASASLDRYTSLPWDQLIPALTNTIVLMVIVPTATLALSIAFSWVVLRSSIRGRGWFDFIVFLPHAVPNIIFGIGALLFTLFVLRNVVPLYGSLMLLVIVFTVVSLAYGTRMTNSGFIQIHRELEESAQVSGAGTGSVLREVTLPLIAPTLFGAWLWIALMASRELTLAVVLTTRDNMTLPVVMWGLWMGGGGRGMGDAAAVAFLMFLVMSPLVALYWWAARRRGTLVR